MSKYPKINYIGNKNKLTDWIVENLPYKKGTVLDLFCGGCSVSYALKDHNYQVITNDVLYSNYVISKAIIENKKVTLNKKDIDVKIDKKDIDNKYNNIKFLSNKLYFDEEVHELAELLCIAICLMMKKIFILSINS
jgi:adenine-specific DNA-methyltransferase